MFTGVVDTAGIQITSVVWTEGTNQTHNAGSTVVDYTTATHMAATTKGLIVSHNQDGSLIGSAVRTALNQTAATGAGWTTLGYTPNTVVYNGNRSYTCTINATDATGTLSPGMRIQATRTVTAPTKSTSLNGTSQYYSKASPNKLTFTNNFVVSAWVKFTSYAASSIASRYNGTSGWDFQIDINGRPNLVGVNGGSGNYKQTLSYQSIPLNKWVHVAAQLDMTSATNSPTVNYVMIDGIDVPAQQAVGGTSPTALIQAGNLEIGSRNAGLQTFPGKIAQVAIYSAKVTQANIVATISQTLTGSETSLASAYSFNTVITDLNTTTPNDLTANNGAVATNADTPFTQTNGLTGYTVGTTNFGIVTASSFSTNTTLVVQVPEGDTLPTTGGISAVSYSTQKVPFAFPAQTEKWRVTTFYVTQYTTAIGSISQFTASTMKVTVPIGEWNIGFQLNAGFTSTVSGVREGEFTMSATTPTYGSYSNALVTHHYQPTGTFFEFRTNAQIGASLAAAATYTVYGGIQSATGSESFILINGSEIFATCAYL